MSNLILPGHAATITVAASDKLATFSTDAYSIIQRVGFPNRPDAETSVFAGSGNNVTSAFSAQAEVTIRAGDQPLYYATGTAPAISERERLYGLQSAPGALNATGTLTGALILGGIVTSSTAAAVTATLDTGEAMDAVIDMEVGDSFDWSAINTGSSYAFTVTASNDHTIVGAGAVAQGTSGRFRTRKTAAETFVTYRLS